MAELVKTKKIDGIPASPMNPTVRESASTSNFGDVKIPNVLLNQLLKHTQLQDSFGVIMLALVNNEPKVLNLLQMLEYYLDHQKDVVTRRTKYDLNKAGRRRFLYLRGLIKGSGPH